MLKTRWAAAGVVALAIVALISAMFSSGTAHEDDDPVLLAQTQAKKNKKANNQAGKKQLARLLQLPDHAVSLTLTLGATDKQPTPWDGSVAVSEGKVLEIDIVRGGGQNARVEDQKFFLRSTQPPAKKVQGVVSPMMIVSLDSPPTATVTFETIAGNFAFSLADLTAGSEKTFLDGRVLVEREDAALRITPPETEDDFPALARAANDALWLAYVEYTPSAPVLPERILNGDFELLVPSGHGDRVLLRHFDGREWQMPLGVTSGGLDVWRPTTAVDGAGRVWVAWSEQKNANWDVYCRCYTPEKNTWSVAERLSTDAGADFHTVAATDSTGTVWVAWQGWRNDNFDIFAARLGDKPQVQTVAATPADDWSPAIAADALGNVYVAFDTYEKGNYDVRLARLGKNPDTRMIAESPRFEARASIVCDAANRVWVAYEEGEEQWGKDYSTAEFRKIPFDRNLGSALYSQRTVRLKCVENESLLTPAADLEKAWAPRLPRKKSVPRLALDGSGGLWLFVRHHPLVGGGGEVWHSYAVRYNGTAWTPPRHLPHSSNLLDNRPALAAFKTGLMAVYSGDRRVSTQNRGQDDLFAVVLPGDEQVAPPQLVPAGPPPAAELTNVHPNEIDDLRRIRGYRVKTGGKELRLIRGDFHRHTEYSSHADQDGLLEDCWRYALDAGNLDWLGDGDHDNGFNHEYMWWQIQKVTDMFLHPPRFLAAQSYERSVQYPNGHRNVIMPRRGIRPLMRGPLPGTPAEGTPDTKTLYAYLRHFGGMCSSHTSGTSMGTDWRDNDPEVEPVVEIYQGHRHNYEHPGAPRSATKETQIGGFEPAGVVWNALAKGYRLGFQSSSDHISTHISYAVVLTDDFSRPGLIAAFKQRHSYAATDNIIFDVHCGDHIMGDIFDSPERPVLAIHVEGTGPIARLDVIRDNAYVLSAKPNERTVDLKFTDTELAAGKTSYYYVRIEQVDGNLAWASPMWITYKP